ncbi:YciI family protein [Zymomonas sp.]|uniref:YciI family protein n=1 Tax=Zymomonas sp. TaxID=2068624 RepID=UPI0025DA2FD0|nr:YciI family protein [Zymomonas sp.]MCA1956888.1 YciI family protein [Zymomonas sp.]
MFIVNLFYKKPISEIEKHIKAHRDFLDIHYQSGYFLASGAKNPRNGGIILVNSQISRDHLEQILLEDPFRQNDIADYEIIEFVPSKYASILADNI